MLVDNSDRNYTEARGDWATVGDGPGHQGFDYRTHQPGPTQDSFTWKADIPVSGRYEVAVRFPEESAVWLADPRRACPGGGETLDEVADRVGAGLRKLIAEREGENAAPKPMFLINPTVLWTSDERALTEEGCL